MKMPKEATPSIVPATAKQEGEPHARWVWVEPAAWTEQMLATLDKGVKGGVWYSLIDKVWLPRNLAAAWAAVERNGGAAGTDGQSVSQFSKHAEGELARMHQRLKEGSYEPQPVRRAWVDKPGSQEKRPLGIPAVRDRIVQGALRHVLEPIFERDFHEHSYGFRPGRGAKDALRRVDGLLHEGQVWVLDADLKSYFDTIPHERLLDCLRQKVSDARVLELVEKFLKAGVMESMKPWTPTQKGTPQGAVISPLLANIYLDELDHLMAAHGYAMTRYADDFVVQCRSQEQAEAAWQKLREWTSRRGLSLHPDKTRIVDARQPGEGFDFLGYHFERGQHWPRAKSMQKLREAIRARTPRQNGQSLRTIITGLNAVLRGWYGYFKHSPRTTFAAADGFARRRVRNVLCRRHKLEAKGKSPEANRRWPNTYLAEHGLFSMTAAHARERQSRLRAPH